MPYAIETVLDDPEIAAFRASQARKISCNPDTARAVWVSRLYGKLPGPALALFADASLMRDEGYEAAHRFLSDQDRAALGRVEAALSHIVDRPLTADDEQRAALERLDRVLPMPGTRSPADEQARVENIRALGRLAKQQDVAEKMIVAGATVEQARLAITNAKAASSGAEISTTPSPIRSASADGFDAIALETYGKK